MGKLWTLIIQLHSLSWPVLALLYPLYASVMAIESTSKVDDEQWLAYWIIYSFLSLVEMVLQPVLEWIPIWYDVKLLFVAWLALPQFQGAAFLYDRYVREQIKKYRGGSSDHQHGSPNGQNEHNEHNEHNGHKGHKGKTKFVQLITPKKGEHKAS